MERVRLAGLALLFITACKATIPDGIIACDTDNDCPTGKVCRRDETGAGLFCYGEGLAPGDRDAGDGDGSGDGDMQGLDGAPMGSDGATNTLDGAMGSGDAGFDAGLPQTTDPVAPSVTGFSTLGGRRGDGTVTVYEDGFERGARMCTADGLFCISGSFEP